MNHKLLAVFCFLSAACVGTVLSHGLISQSAIYQCDWGDETEPTVGAEPCKQKFVVSMALSSGQVCRCDFITAPAVSIYLLIFIYFFIFFIFIRSGKCRITICKYWQGISRGKQWNVSTEEAISVRNAEEWSTRKLPCLLPSCKFVHLIKFCSEIFYC